MEQVEVIRDMGRYWHLVLVLAICHENLAITLFWNERYMGQTQILLVTWS